MTDWITDERPENTRRFGDITLVSQTHKRARTTAHLITLSDGRQLRVLPDGSMSGQRRSRLVRGALEALDALRDKQAALVDPDYQEPYLVGRLWGSGLAVEQVGNVREPTIEEWLGEWFDSIGEHACTEALLVDLEADGWQIVKAE